MITDASRHDGSPAPVVEPEPLSTRHGAPTMLTRRALTRLRTQAARTAGSFVDPHRVTKVERWWNPDLREWAAAVVGHAVTDLRRLPWREWVLLDLAHDAEPAPPPPSELTARHALARDTAERHARAERASREATDQEWAALRAALPVGVRVAHNYTSHRHVEGYVQGGDHIMLLEPLQVGRLSRDAGQPLCWIPSRASDLTHFSDQDDTSERRPTCKRCLRTAYCLTERTPSDLLMTTRRSR